MSSQKSNSCSRDERSNNFILDGSNQFSLRGEDDSPVIDQSNLLSQKFEKISIETNSKEQLNNLPIKINTSLSLVMQIEKMTNRTEQEEILNKAKSYLDDDCGIEKEEGC